MIYEWMKDKRPCKMTLKERLDGDFLIVYGEQLEICYLNKTSAMILQACNGRHTVEDILQMLFNRFNASKEELKTDLIDILRDLQWKRLIVLEGEA